MACTAELHVSGSVQAFAATWYSVPELSFLIVQLANKEAVAEASQERTSPPRVISALKRVATEPFSI